MHTQRNIKHQRALFECSQELHYTLHRLPNPLKSEISECATTLSKQCLRSLKRIQLTHRQLLIVICILVSTQVDIGHKCLFQKSTVSLIDPIIKAKMKFFEHSSDTC